MFAFEPRELHAERCEEVEIVLENNDEVRHDLMIPGLNPIFALNVVGPDDRVGALRHAGRGRDAVPALPRAGARQGRHDRQAHRRQGRRAEALAQAPARGDGAELYKGVGVVIAAVPRVGRLIVNHEEIKGFMAAMEMSYPVAPPSLLNGLNPGRQDRLHHRRGQVHDRRDRRDRARQVSGQSRGRRGAESEAAFQGASQHPPRRRYRRHLHRHRGVRRQDRRAHLRQGAVDAAAAGRRHQPRGREGRQRLPLGRPVPARLDGRDQHHPGAHRRQDRAADHRRLPRHLRDRPHQPAGRLQSVLPEARAAGRARAALRGAGSACSPTARSRRRSTRRRSRRSARSSTKRGIEACAILFINCYASPDHEARAKAILEKNHPEMFVSASHELSQEYREFERCSTVVANAYIGPKVRRYVGEIDEHIRSEGFDGSFLIVQSTGGLYEAAQAQNQCVRMLESGPGRRRHRHAGALPHARHRQRHRLRHGRHHRQGRRDLQGRGADHLEGADRRLRQGAAGADRHDGHLRGRHRRRLDRARRSRRPARRAAERRRVARAGLLRARRHRADRHRRQSRARAARRRSLPRRRDAARRRGRRARDRDASPSRSASTSPRRRTASCGSPRPRCPTR